MLATVDTQCMLGWRITHNQAQCRLCTGFAKRSVVCAQGLPADDAVHPLWRQLKDAAGRTVYLNPFSGWLPDSMIL